jgi:amino acid transporter
VPLVFLFGAIGIAIIAHGFIRLTQRYNHAGSAYALVGVTVGPRAGFFSGFAILGTYTMFATGTVAASASFLDAFISALLDRPFHVPWLLTTLVVVGLSAVLNSFDIRLVTTILLVIEGVGIVCMLILGLTVLGKGGAGGHGLDASTFSLHGVSFSGVMGAVVAAFLSWAGFEGCAALGEETDNPRRNIPRALLWSIVLTGVLFVFVMFIQTVGFGTDAAGLKTFSSTGNSLSALGETYLGRAFSLVIAFAALMSAFACHLSSTATSGRLLFAFSRDGFGPKEFGRLRGRHAIPISAIFTVLAVTLVINVASWASGRPVLGTGQPALDSYFYFATIGAVMLMIAYLMVEVAAILHLRKRRPAEVVIPVVGLLIIVAVFYFNVKGQTSVTAPPYVAFLWALVGLAIACLVPGLAARVGEKLALELDEPAGKELPMTLGVPGATAEDGTPTATGSAAGGPL